MSSTFNSAADFFYSDALCFKLTLGCMILNCFDSNDFRLRIKKLWPQNFAF